jgi:hypothetical protein
VVYLTGELTIPVLLKSEGHDVWGVFKRGPVSDRDSINVFRKQIKVIRNYRFKRYVFIRLNYLYHLGAKKIIPKPINKHLPECVKNIKICQKALKKDYDKILLIIIFKMSRETDQYAAK